MEIENNKTFVGVEDKNKKKIISKLLMKNFNNLNKKNTNKSTNDIVIICIGTDRSTGDSLGPLVGQFLVKNKCNFPVYGTLKKPVHARNIEKVLKKIEHKHKNSTIIAVDASLGSLQHVNNISISDDPIRPGSGVGKNLPSVGDISITGIVNTNGSLNFMTLQNTRLYDVYSLAKNISNGILLFTNKLSYLNNSKIIRKES